jgi:deoxycytidine triphosphate deaminase
VILSDRSLRQALEDGHLVVDPLEEEAIQPSSIDLRIDNRFRVFHNARYPYIDVKRPMEDLTELVEVKRNDPFILHPGEFVLASTFEFVGIPADLAARLEGKALAVRTPVPTPAGWTTMGDLAPGDLVFDERGCPCAVVGATEVLLGRPCHEVVFSDGQSIVADAQHRWLTVDGDGRRRGRGRGRLVTTARIAGGLRAGGEPNHHVPLAGPACYPARRLPVDPYALGLRLGGGTAAASGKTGAGGDADHIPPLYLSASVAQRSALLEGLMDGGGSADTRGRCAFVSAEERLADAVVELAASLGFDPAKSKDPATRAGIDRGPRYLVGFTPDRPVFRLPRKRERQRLEGAHQRFRAIVDVREVGSVPVRCVQVSSPSGMFLVGSTFIPTHNSSLGRLGLLTHSTAGFLDPGFQGHVTLELSNVANLPITLYPGMRIGQIAVFELTTPAERPYGSGASGSKYQGQRGPTPSRYWQNFQP